MRYVNVVTRRTVRVGNGSGPKFLDFFKIRVILPALWLLSSAGLAVAAGSPGLAPEFSLGQPRPLLPSRSTALAVSPDGRIAAVGTFAGGEVVLWDIRSNRPIASLRQESEPEDPGPVMSLSFSSDGSLLAATQLRQPGVRIWHVDDRRLLRTINLPNAGLSRIAVFSPRQRLLAIPQPGRLTVVDAASGEVSSSFSTGSNRETVSLSWSDCGEMIRVGANFDGNRLAWFRVKDGERVGQSPPLAVPAFIVLSLGEKELAVSRSGGGLSRVISDDWSHLAILAPHGSALLAAAQLTADKSLLVTRANDFRIHVSKLESQELGETVVQFPLGTTGAHVGPSFSELALTPDGELVGWTRRDRHFEMVPLRNNTLLSGLPGHRGAVRNLRWGSDGATLFSYGDDGVLIAWDLETRRDRWRRYAGPSTVPLWARASAEMASMDQEFWILTSGEADLRFTRWSAEGKLLQDSSLEARSPRAASIDPVRRMGLTTGQRNQGVEAWNLLNDSAPVTRFAATSEQGAVDSAISAKGEWLAVRKPAGIEIWDQRRGPAARPYLNLHWPTNTPSASQLAWSPSGWLLAASGSGQALHIFEMLTGDIVHTFEPIGFSGSAGLMDYPRPFTWLDGKQYLLAVGDRNDVSIVDLRSGTEWLRLTGAGSRVVSLTSRQGKIAAGLEDGSVSIWRLPDTIDGAVRKEPRLSEVRQDWERLGQAKGREVLQLIDKLAAQPRVTIGLMTEELAASQIDSAGLAELLDGLSSDLFRVREQSMEELKVVAETHAEELARLLVERSLPEEARARVEQVIAGRSEGWRQSVEVRRMLRSLWVLQTIGTAESYKVISDLRQNAAESPVTRQAQLILDTRPNSAEP